MEFMEFRNIEWSIFRRAASSQTGTMNLNFVREHLSDGRFHIGPDRHGYT